MRACARPCAACPWRADSKVDDIPNFSLDLAEDLAATCSRDGYGPGFNAPMFACHESKPRDEKACAGWVAVEGDAHPNVRIMVLSGELPVEALAPRDGWPELLGSFAEVIEKLRAG